MWARLELALGDPVVWFIVLMVAALGSYLSWLSHSVVTLRRGLRVLEARMREGRVVRPRAGGEGTERRT